MSALLKNQCEETRPPFVLEEVINGNPFEILEKDGDLIAAMSEWVRADKQLAIVAILSSATAYISLTDELKRDPDVYRLAVQINGSMYTQLPTDLLREPGLLASALRTCPRALDHARKNGVGIEDHETLMAACYSAQYSHNLYHNHLFPICKNLVKRNRSLLGDIFKENKKLAEEISSALEHE